MDLINGYSPKVLKYFDNNYDLNNKKSDNAFPGKKMFNSVCYLKNPKKYNNINLNENFLNFDHFKAIVDDSALSNNEESKNKSEEESKEKSSKKNTLGQLADIFKQGMIETENENNSGDCDKIEEEIKKYKKEIKKYKEENSKYKEQSDKYKKYMNNSQNNQYNIEYNPNMMTLHEHENEAIKRGGHLISIHNTFDLNQIKKYWDKNCWIGAVRISANNPRGKGKDTWKWMDGSEWNYENFDSKEPNSVREEGIHIRRNGKWNDGLTQWKLPGIYKIPKKAVNNQLNNCKKKIDIIDDKKKLNEKISLNNMGRMEQIIYNNTSQLNSNIDNMDNFSNFENSNIIENFSGVDELVKYNEDLTEKQKVQEDKIKLIKEKELSLEKTNALFKSSFDRNNFKKKIISTLIAVIFLLFILSISTYVYLIRDFKINN